MLFGVFAIYDSGISTWLTPLYFRNKGEAIRWWAEVCNNPEAKISKHPADYTLFEVGTWNDDNNSFNLLAAPVKLGLALEFVKTIPAEGARGLGTGPQERSEATGDSKVTLIK